MTRPAGGCSAATMCCFTSRPTSAAGREWRTLWGTISAVWTGRPLWTQRSCIPPTGRRTAELKAHHARRLEDTLRTVEKAPGLTAYQIAGRMRWSIRCRNWADFPLAQKFFAVGEALAHLDHLEAQGRVFRQEIHGKRVYFAGVGDKI